MAKVTIPRKRQNETQQEHLLRALNANATAINRNIVSNVQESHQLQRVLVDQAFQNRRIEIPNVTPDMMYSIRGMEDACNHALAAAATGQIGIKDARDFIDATLSHRDRMVAEAIDKMKNIARDLAERRTTIAALNQVPDAETVPEDNEPKQIQQQIISPTWHTTPEEQKRRNVKETAAVTIRPEGTR